MKTISGSLLHYFWPNLNWCNSPFRLLPSLSHDWRASSTVFSTSSTGGMEPFYFVSRSLALSKWWVDETPHSPPWVTSKFDGFPVARLHTFLLPSGIGVKMHFYFTIDLAIIGAMNATGRSTHHASRYNDYLLRPSALRCRAVQRRMLISWDSWFSS